MSRLELLGQNIKKFREKRNLRQQDIAIALDCSFEYICRVERGQKYLSLRRLFELADTLGVDVKDLMNFK